MVQVRSVRVGPPDVINTELSIARCQIRPKKRSKCGKGQLGIGLGRPLRNGAACRLRRAKPLQACASTRRTAFELRHTLEKLPTPKNTPAHPSQSAANRSPFIRASLPEKSATGWRVNKCLLFLPSMLGGRRFCLHSSRRTLGPFGSACLISPSRPQRKYLRRVIRLPCIESVSPERHRRVTTKCE